MIPPASRKAGAAPGSATAKVEPPAPKTAKEVKAQKKLEKKAAKDAAKKDTPAASRCKGNVAPVKKPVKSVATANPDVTLGDRKKKPSSNPFKILMGRD